MAKKTVELTPIKRGKADFTLVGKVDKINDYTFGLDIESSREDSDWVYSKANIGINCGENGVIYAEMNGGYGTDRVNEIRANGKKEDGQTDFNVKINVAWEDRHDEDILENIGDRSFVNVGLVKGEDGKTEYKKFLSEYDAVPYIKEHLEEGMVVRVKGNLDWQEYNGKVTCKKQIKSIALSQAKEEDFDATFTQTVFLDEASIGKLDKDTMCIPLDCYIPDYVQRYQDRIISKKVGNRTVKGTFLPLPRTLDFKIDPADKETTMKKLNIFKVKKGKVTMIAIEGKFVRGEVETEQVKEVDIPDDLLELIELGFVDRDEVVGKLTVKGGNKKPEKMIVEKPFIRQSTDKAVGGMERDLDTYTPDDLDIELILESFNTKLDTGDTDKEEEDVDIDKVANEVMTETEDEDSDDDWLANL